MEGGWILYPKLSTHSLFQGPEVSSTSTIDVLRVFLSYEGPLPSPFPCRPLEISESSRTVMWIEVGGLIEESLSPNIYFSVSTHVVKTTVHWLSLLIRVSNRLPTQKTYRNPGNPDSFILKES